MEYRNLTSDEIELLIKNRCTCDNWNNIAVAQNFSAAKICNTNFFGSIKLGSNNGFINDINGIKKDSGIYNCEIYNSSIGNNCRLSNIGTLSNYIIEDNVVLESIGSMITDQNTNFGEGVKIDVLNEGGGREITLFRDYSAQLAYLKTLYRHDLLLQKHLEALIDSCISNNKSNSGLITSYSNICNTSEIYNTLICCKVNINGALKICNGTIISESKDHVNIGSGVILENFIIRGSTEIDNSAIIKNSFVGEGVNIGDQFSAANSMFFANSEAFHGEACSIFAGPYTVSHHKSSLLIAGIYSFYNAGSGTNQSNHMYKLGPVHQGIIERGSKTGSGSYLLWPSKVGPFSVVLGKHYNNFDASDFPFSYISEEDGKSIITPAMNIFAAGTKRDVNKWASRDRRKSDKKLDRITYDLFSPFIMGRIIRASEILEKLYAETPRDKNLVSHKGLYIPRLIMRTCKKYYDLAIDTALGDKLIELIKNKNINSMDDLLLNFADVHDQDYRNDKWVDMAGMITSQKQLSHLIQKINPGSFKTISEFNFELDEIFSKYNMLCWLWYNNLIYEKYQTDKTNITNAVVIEILRNWKDKKTKLLNMILKDAEKEFDASSKIGYGIDGDESIKDLDFQNVRGEFRNHKFNKEIEEEIKEIADIYDESVAFFS